MVPGRSALTVTPSIAAAVPITDNVEGQVSFCATTVVTAVGGGWKLAPWAMAASTWRNFANPRPPIRPASTTNIKTIRFAIRSPNLKQNNWLPSDETARCKMQLLFRIDFTNCKKDSELCIVNFAWLHAHGGRPAWHPHCPIGFPDAQLSLTFDLHQTVWRRMSVAFVRNRGEIEIPCELESLHLFYRNCR